MRLMIDRGVQTPTSEESLRERAVRAFAERFGRPPTLAAVAPGRINLIGEHTDYNDGFVLPMAINLAAIIVGDFAPAGRSTFHALDLNESIAFEMVRAGSTTMLTSLPPFARHLAGVAGQFIERGIEPPELDLLLMSDLPIGGGLSSSAAIEVAAALVIEQAGGVSLDPLTRARLCQRAEHMAVGVPCGIMDLLIACRGVRDHALLIDCQTCCSQPMPWPPADQLVVIVVDTGVRHTLAGSGYADRRRTCEEVAKQLGVAALRDATLSMLAEHELNEIQQKRAAHVISENTRTLLAAAALRDGDLDTFGELLFASHDSLRDLFAVSCAELDTIVDAARELRDGGAVIGARMTGGGFGGSAIVLARADAVDDVGGDLSRAFQAAHHRAPTMRRVQASDAARHLSVGSR